MASQYLTELQEDLATIRDAKAALLANGQEHTLNGSHTHKGVSYADLCREERQLRAKIAQVTGGKNYTLPEFS